MRTLLVEDEPQLASQIRQGLEAITGVVLTIGYIAWGIYCKPPMRKLSNFPYTELRTAMARSMPIKHVRTPLAQSTQAR